MGYGKLQNLYLAALIVGVIASALKNADMPLLPGADVHANGFTVPLAQGESGPYNYLVGIWPAEPVVGNLHMAIALTSEYGPVTDARVNVRGRIGQRGPLSKPVSAPGNFLQPWSYELDMRLSEPGRWIFEIQVDSSLGETVLEVPLEVESESIRAKVGAPGRDNGLLESGGPNWVLISGILALLALGSGGWGFMQRQRSKSEPAKSRGTRPDRRRRRR